MFFTLNAEQLSGISKFSSCDVKVDDVEFSKFKLEVVSLVADEDVAIVVSLFKIDVEPNVQTSKNTNATPNIKVLSIIL